MSLAFSGRRRRLDRPVALGADHHLSAGWRTACWMLGSSCWWCWRRSICWCGTVPRISAFSPTATPSRRRRRRRGRRTWSTPPGSRSTGRCRARCAPRASGGSPWAIFCGLFAWYAVQVHQTKYLVEVGFSPVHAAWALGLVSWPASPVRSRSARSRTGSAASGCGRSAARVRALLCRAAAAAPRALAGAALADGAVTGLLGYASA